MTSGRRRAADDGVTLVELLTAIAISSVLLAFVTGTIVDALHAQHRQVAEVGALDDAKVALERVTRDIRGADPLQEAALDRVAVDVRGEGGSVRSVTYARDGDLLVATDPSTGKSRTLLGDLAAGQPLFLYQLIDGSTATGEDPIDARLVDEVTVHLRVDPGDGGHVIDVQSRVILRNAAS
jgi:prepilin-type N-terminal cleavage/methylation domain-containing protein